MLLRLKMHQYVKRKMMKCKMYSLLLTLVFMVLNQGLACAYSYRLPCLSLIYSQSDFVIMAKSKSTGMQLDFEFVHFFKGRPKACKSIRYPKDYLPTLFETSFEQDSTYLLFVKGKELHMNIKILGKPNLQLWGDFFKELDSFLDMKPSQNQFNVYKNWLSKHLKEQELQKVVLWELLYNSRYTWLCRDSIHIKEDDHDDCVIPPILNRQDQYYVLDILEKRGRIVFERYIFNHHLDSIASQYLQRYFYATFLNFYQQNLKDNNGSGFPKKWTNWKAFLELFQQKTTNPELIHLMKIYFNTPESLHHDKSYLEDENNILFQITDYIQQNKPMFSTS